MDCGSTILIFLAVIQATFGQSVTLTGPSAIKQDRDTVYTCTGGASQFNFIWSDFSVNPNVNIFQGGLPTYPTIPDEDSKYLNFGVSENEGTSTMTISNTQIEDKGQYRCTRGAESDDAELKVEVNSTKSLSVESTIESNLDMYVATCEAREGRPEVTITWMLGDGPSPCDETVVTHPTAGTDLSSTRSVCTFQATSENYGQTLTCVISGHQVSDLNENKTITLDMHSAPRNDSLKVTFQFPDTSLRVSCDIVGADQPDPLPRNYSIFSDGTQIPQSSTGINFVVVQESDFDLETEFYCQAWNYLGIATSQTTKPTRTTTPTPTTTAALEKTTKSGDETGSGPGTGPDPPPIGLIIGCVVAVIVIIGLIIVVIVVGKKKRWFKSSGTKSSGSSKPAGSAVGSSNGSEREKTKPEAAPRGHGSIQHTNDNPNQDMYAMVDKKPSGGRGGDAPDRGSGPGQNEPQGMLYADLDLSHKAGHTDKHVPKNENDVVVYSSILV